VEGLWYQPKKIVYKSLKSKIINFKKNRKALKVFENQEVNCIIRQLSNFIYNNLSNIKKNIVKKKKEGVKK
jgi:hypothetical protein